MKRIIIIFLFVLLLLNCKDITEQDDYILNLPPMKDQFASYFMIGNIFNPGDVSSSVTNKMLNHHFNVLTHENNMKPSYIAPGRKSYNFSIADNMVNVARQSGFRVVGHTLLWHSQIPSWQQNISGGVALSAMREYITDVVGHFKGRIYSWDVLNEVFPDGGYTGNWRTSMRNENPWFRAIGSDFVYEGFLAARLADPGAILYYNDYNTDMAGKAKMIHDMVRDVNARYATLSSSSKPPGEPPGRKLIEGIGMQEHHNTGISPSAVRASIDLFRTLGVKLSVSELDVLSQTWNEYSRSAAITKEGRDSQASLYGAYMRVYLDNSDIIERLTLWGVTDNQSWRARGEPLLFNASGIAKPAYYRFISAR